MTISKVKQKAKRDVEIAARRFGYKGPMSELNKYMKTDPLFARKMSMFKDKIKAKQNQTTTVKMDQGGDAPALATDTGAEDIKSLFSTLLKREPSPSALKYYEDQLASGLTVGDISNSIVNSEEYKTLTADPNKFPDKPTYSPVSVSKIGDTTEAQKVKFKEIKDEDIAKIEDPREVVTKQITAPTKQDVVKTTTTDTQKDVEKEIDKLDPEITTLSEKAQVTAQEKAPTDSAVADLKAAEIDEARKIQDAPTRTLQADEIIAGSTVDQAKINEQLAQIEAAQMDLSPEATIKGQLGALYQNFDVKNPPAWADGAVRTAMATLNARGMGASSLAGQAVVQTVMENALPIAQADAQAVFNLGIQNLTNRQQTVILAAQQRATFLGQEFDQSFQTRVANAARVSEIANIQFNADQQIALENAKLAQTVDLANLNNRQAMVIANAAQVANLETTNLNNRQQAEVQNAQAFLQVDLANLNNRQQTALFKTQQIVQSLFTDAAAQNAAAQFNATSENQVNQFYDGLQTTVKEFNATQYNATEKFNVQSELAVDEFNAQTQNSVDQFNASNGLVISQANAEWERNKATVDTAAQNQANQFNAQMEMQLTVREFEGMLQEYRDAMAFAQESSENVLDRETQLGIATINKQSMIESAKFAMTGDLYKAFGTLGAQMLANTDVLGGAFKFLENVFTGGKTKTDTDTGGGGAGGAGGTDIDPTDFATAQDYQDALNLQDVDQYGDGGDAQGTGDVGYDEDTGVGVDYVPSPDAVEYDPSLDPNVELELPEDTSDYSTFR